MLIKHLYERILLLLLLKIKVNALFGYRGGLPTYYMYCSPSVSTAIALFVAAAMCNVDREAS